MKQIERKIALLLSLMTMMSMAAGCGGGGTNNSTSSEDYTQTIDTNKTQITMSVFNGGYGYAWAIEAAREWNETNDKYQVIVPTRRSRRTSRSSSMRTPPTVSFV